MIIRGATRWLKLKKKIFVFFAGVDPQWEAITVKVTPELREVWLGRSDTFIPSYVGRFGWCGIRLKDQPSLELAFEGIAISYGLVTKMNPHRISLPNPFENK